MHATLNATLHGARRLKRTAVRGAQEVAMTHRKVLGFVAAEWAAFSATENEVR